MMEKYTLLSHTTRGLMLSRKAALLFMWLTCKVAAMVPDPEPIVTLEPRQYSDKAFAEATEASINAAQAAFPDLTTESPLSLALEREIKLMVAIQKELEVGNANSLSDPLLAATYQEYQKSNYPELTAHRIANQLGIAPVEQPKEFTVGKAFTAIWNFRLSDYFFSWKFWLFGVSIALLLYFIPWITAPKPRDYGRPHNPSTNPSPKTRITHTGPELDEHTYIVPLAFYYTDGTIRMLDIPMQATSVESARIAALASPVVLDQRDKCRKIETGDVVALNDIPLPPPPKIQQSRWN